MAERLFRSCLTSRRVNGISLQAEVCFYRMIQAADDYGTLPADAYLLKATLFPIRNIRTADIARWFRECESAGLIASYDGVDGHRYASIRNFDQRLAFKKRRYPAPPFELFANEENGEANSSLSLSSSSSVSTSVSASSPYSPPSSPAGDIAHKLYGAYPKKFGMLEGMKAALRTIETQSSQGKSYETIETELMTAVRRYAEETSRWNWKRKRFIWSMKTFFEAGHYADDPECWRDDEAEAPAQTSGGDPFVTLPDGSKVRRSVL